MNAVAALAVAEFRSAWRGARGRLFGCALGVFTAWLFGGYMHWHADNPVPYLASAYSLPRFLIAQFGAPLLALSLLALLFVLFDAGHRDQQAGIADALDSRPASNTARLWGRLAAGVVVVWLPTAAALGLVQALGALARANDWWMGDTIEPVSLASFLTVDLLPALAAWGAVVLVLATCLRNRAAVLLGASALLGSLAWAAANIPVYLHDALLPFAAPVGFASDLAPRFADGFALAQRTAALTAAFGLMALTARFAPRLEDRYTKRKAAFRGGAAAIVGGVALALAVFWRSHDLELRADWRRVHEGAANAGVAAVDIQRVAGTIAIAPGERLAIDVQLAFTAAGNAPIHRLVFSFNPGMSIAALRMEGMAGFDHQHGLLTIRLTEPLPPGASRTMAVQAEGVPDARFAYLDGAVDPFRVGARNRIWQLGREASLFEETYVALMPGVRWLPTPGANIAHEDARGDFFEVDLKVTVPLGWLVAGPGLRRPAADGFAFHPPAPVRDVALFAAPFAQRALSVDGVRVEVLAAPAHLDNLASLVGDGRELARQVRELFAAAQQVGLPYPYDGLSLVEVPARLRAYRGGALLSSALELPGVLAVREPIATVRFEKRLTMFAPGPAKGRMQLVKEFLRTDHHGGDLYRAFAFNLFGAVTGARGSAALEALCRELAYLLVVVPPRFAYHPTPAQALAHSFHVDAPPAALVVNLANTALGGNWASLGAQSRRPARADVWEYMLGRGDAAAQSGDPRVAEQAAYETALRASRTANAITELLGRERTAAMLARLRRRFAGGAFEAAGLAGAGADRAVHTVVEHWLARQSLPGFATSEAVVTPAINGNGHHVRLHLRNSTAAPGVAFVSTHQFPWRADAVRTRPLLIEPNPAVEIGMATPQAPAELWLHTYLSLHREPRLVPTVIATRGPGNAEAFIGARASTWRPPPARGIVVDDLSAGFSVQGASKRQVLFARFGPPPLLDAGLAAGPVGPGRWRRMSAPTAVGRYRRTAARALPAHRGEQAVFRAELPVAGRWRLDYHLPPRRPNGRDAWGNLDQLGGFALRLRAGAIDQAIAFDGRAAAGGWNTLGEYDLPAGPATLAVGTRTNGRVVIADAIRWQLTTGRSQSPPQPSSSEPPAPI